MQRKIFLTLVFMIVSVTNCFAVVDLIFNAAKWLGDQAKEVTEEVFRVNMLKQTIESVATVKRNYEESVKYYNDMKRIVENPYSFGEEIKQQFLRRLENPVDKFWYEVDKKASEKPGWLGKQEQKAQDYIQKNWNFADAVKEQIRKRDKQLTEIVNKLGSTNKADVEKAKNELSTLQSEQLSSIEKNLVKLIEIQNRVLEQQHEREIDLRRQQLAFQEDIKKMFETRYGPQAKREYKTREEKAISILGETPKK